MLTRRLIAVGAFCLFALVLVHQSQSNTTRAQQGDHPVATPVPGEQGLGEVLFVTQRVEPGQPLSDADRERIIQEYLTEAWKYKIQLDAPSTDQPDAQLQTLTAPMAGTLRAPIIFMGGADSSLWVINATGTISQALTPGITGISDPTKSSDGSQIVFAADNAASIYVVAADGTGLRQIASGLNSVGAFAWSHDRKRLVFSAIKPDGKRGTYVINADGTEQAQQAADISEHSVGADWSPDGRWLAIPAKRPDEKWGIYKLEVATQQGVWLPGGFACSFTSSTCVCALSYFTSDIVWSPDGSQIAFVGAKTSEGKCNFAVCCSGSLGLFILDAQGTSDPRLIGDLSSTTSTSGNGFIGSGRPRWNRDGTRLLAPGLQNDGKWRICLGSTSTPMIQLNGKSGEGNAGADWSPNETRLVAGVKENGVNQLYVVDPVADFWGDPIGQGKWPNWAHAMPGVLGNDAAPSTYVPDGSDELFVGEAAPDGAPIVNIDVTRHFSNTIPTTVTLELMARSPDGPSTAQVYLNGTSVGDVQLGADFAKVSLWTMYPGRIPGIKFGKIPWDLIQTPLAAGKPITSATGLITDSEPVIARTNTITITGQPDLQVAWAALRIEGALRPIVFVHGWTGDETTFKRFAELAASSEGRVLYLDPKMMDLKRGVESDAYTVSLIQDYIDITRIQFGVDKVNIVAHSRGGVLSRLGLGNDSEYGLDTAVTRGDLHGLIDGLVTISSPHHGNDGINLIGWINPVPGGPLRNCQDHPEIPGFKEKCQEIADSLLPEPMRQKNYGAGCTVKFTRDPNTQDYIGRWTDCKSRFERQKAAAQSANSQDRVRYAALSGSIGDISHENATYPWLNSCYTRVAPQGQRLDKSYPYSHTEANTKDDVYLDTIKLLSAPWIAPIFYDCPAGTGVATADSIATVSPDVPALAATVADYHVVAQISGALAAGSSASHPIVLPGGEDARITLFSTPAVSLTLRTPDGELVSPAILPAGVTYQQESSGPDQLVAAYVIAPAQAGVWQLLVDNRGASADTPYALVVETNSTTRLEAATDLLAYDVGAPVTLRAWLLDSDTPLAATATITATITDTGQQYALHDDGAGGDTTAGDGEFTAQLPGFTAATYQTILVQASWPGGQRQQLIAVTIRDRLAQITALGRDALVDLDAEQRWAGLTFPVTIQAQQAGTLTLSGHLLAEDDTRIAGVNQLVKVTAGTQTVNLRFDGDQIHDAQLDGLYRLADLELEGTLGNALTYDRSTLVMTTTQTYAWTMFSGEPIRLNAAPTGTLEVDAAGKPSQLVFTATLDVDFPGPYAWTAELYTRDGQLVARTTPVTQTLGHDSISFTFPASTIAASGLRAPYELRNVSVWQVGGYTVRFFGESQPLATWGNTLFLPMLGS